MKKVSLEKETHEAFRQIKAELYYAQDAEDEAHLSAVEDKIDQLNKLVVNVRREIRNDAESPGD